jgi:hypothetical protein
MVPAIVAPKKKRGWLPLLTVLFLISYGLMTMLIVEQGQTIESQRVLIHELYRDSEALSASKMQAQKGMAARGQNQAPVNAQTPSAKTPSTQMQAPSSQVPSSVAPSTQAPKTPSTQVAPQQRTQGHPGKPQFKVPTRPSEDVTDELRWTRTI